MRATAVLLVALVGCGGYSQLPPAVDLEREATTLAVLARWEAQLGPLKRCRAEKERLRWETAPADVVSEMCTTSLALTACFSYRDGAPVVTIASDTPRSDDQLLIIRVHELTHWALHCSGVDSTGDPAHSRAGVWVGL